jgi:carboxyl-terminal processing protease
MKPLFVFFVSMAMALSSTGFADHPRAPLTMRDIPHMMNKMFAEHLSEKEMSPEIMQRAIHLFIDQFDTNRSYLIARDVSPFENLSKEKVQKVITEYQRSNFSIFYTMVKQFQKGIDRAREIRKKMEYKSYKELEVEIRNASKDPVLSELAPFPQIVDDLEKRIRLKYARAVLAERDAAEQKKTHITFQEASKHVLDLVEEFENSYLYVSKEGKPLTPSQKEDLFAFQVLKALTSSLDAHSAMLDPKEAYTLKMKLQKGFDGVGLEVSDEGKEYVISKIFKNSPAEKNGTIKEGDILLSIDGAKVDDWDLETVLDHLQGKVGTKVEIELQRGTTPPYKVTLDRAKIVVEEGRVESSYEKVDGGIIGKITLHSFYEGPTGVSSVEDMKHALEELSEKGAIKGLVLDLRDNRGGYLMQAVKVAGMFMKSGVVVVSKTQDGKEHFFRDVDTEANYSGPLVVLTSKITASAAEIVAQALKDWGIGIIVGDDHTFGKGSIQMQTVTEAEHGEEPSMKVTVGKFYGASGQTTDQEGVKADIIVPSVLFDKRLGEACLHFPTKPQKVDTIPESFHDTLADVPPEMKDWYLKYYTPNLQERKVIPPALLDQLRKNSAKRIEQNPEYQRFLRKLPLQKVVKNGDHLEITPMTKEEGLRRVWELQLEEAVNIAKDYETLTAKKQNRN